MYGCQKSERSIENGWELKGLEATKSIDNFTFVFPTKGYAFDNRDELAKECVENIKSNYELIELPGYGDTVSIRFLTSRQEMEKFTGLSVAGFVNAHTNTVFIVTNEDANEVKPPIKHELMHLVSMTTWGYPASSSIWMNEGLAAFAENNCNGYNDEQIYSYLLENGMLISIDSLTNDFYGQPEMVAYHQSAYIVQYLLDNYSTKQFKELWMNGFPAFEKIYSISFTQVQTEINKLIKQIHPVAPDIKWDSFQEGCK